MTTQTETAIVQTVVTIMTPIVGIIIVILCALVRKYLHLSIDAKKIENSQKVHDLIEQLAVTAIYKVEDEYKNSKLEDSVDSGKKKLASAVKYVNTGLINSGIKIEVDSSELEANVRAIFQQYMVTYSEKLSEYAKTIDEKIAGKPSDGDATIELPI